MTDNVLVLFEVDPETDEATGAVHAFCSDRCRDEFPRRNADVTYATGIAEEDSWGFAPKCGSCGCPWNWRTGPLR
jgi:hypothetical protein